MRHINSPSAQFLCGLAEIPNLLYNLYITLIETKKYKAKELFPEKSQRVS
jgi:hypothetical protein